MDLNVLSPDQVSKLRPFEYKPIQSVTDASMNQANRSMERVLTTMKLESQRVKKDVSTLQILLDSILLKQKQDPEYIEEIKWDLYYYKKYTYQLHMLWVIIGTCILVNLVPSMAGVILAIATLYIGYRLWDLITRDDSNFDEYNFSNYIGSLNREKAHSLPNTYATLDVDISNCVMRSDHYIQL